MAIETPVESPRDATTSEILEYVKNLHASDEPIDNQHVDQLLFGTSIEDHDHGLFVKYVPPRGTSYYEQLRLKQQRERDFQGESTWGPGKPIYWTDYHIIRGVVRALELKPSDKFYDLGSAYGRVPIWAGVNSEAQCYGIELVKGRTDLMKGRIALLGLQNVHAVTGNIRDLDYSDGTVFFMYSPFSRETSSIVLDQLAEISRSRTVRIAARQMNTQLFDNAVFRQVGEEVYASPSSSRDPIIRYYESIA